MDKAGRVFAKMKEGHLAAKGGHVFLSDMAISNAMASYGYDFLWIDGEHGPFDKHNLMEHVIAANEGGAAAFVRVTSFDGATIKPVLEMGIDGIIIPQVRNAEEARAAIAACLYPPEGVRGYGPRRANRYGMIGDAEYLPSAPGSFLRILQIEHIDAVRNIESILAVEGVDVLIIGPCDLSASMGLIGKSGDARVLAEGKRVIDASHKAGVPIGVSIGPDKERMKLWADAGVDFISAGDDISFLRMGALSLLDEMSKLQ